MVLAALGAPTPASNNGVKNELRARVTYYSPHGDHWGSRVACQKTKIAKEGVTVAAHPSFKFGTKIYIPELDGIIGDGRFIVQDRGGAVTRKVASRGKAFVFDVFVNTDSKLRKYKKELPEYMTVIVE